MARPLHHAETRRFNGGFKQAPGTPSTEILWRFRGANESEDVSLRPSGTQGTVIGVTIESAAESIEMPVGGPVPRVESDVRQADRSVSIRRRSAARDRRGPDAE